MPRRTRPDRRRTGPPASPPAAPEPVDLASESVAGEEDPGAGMDAPAPAPLDDAAGPTQAEEASPADGRSR